MNKTINNLEGILGFPITPFDENNRLDEQALAANINFLLQSGLDAIFICAGSGEFQSLSRSEYETMIDIAVSASNGSVPVFAGVGGNIQHALELTEIASDRGADGILILPPYLIVPEQEGLYRYYKTIAEHTELQAILYQRDNAVFTVQTVERLASIPQIIGFKDGHGNMELNIELVHTIGDRLNWMNGMPFAEVTMPAYKGLGFRSYSSAISNYLPHISRMYYNALAQGDKSLLDVLYREVILPINQVRKLRKGYAVSLIKAGMEIVGLPIGGRVRAPLVEVEKEHYAQLEKLVTRANTLFPPKSPISSELR
ncbi:5-dehydro-4-deoxyglucarate dehydratase [Paenibacillus sp. H1-7]|uniref:5-dehydro-4-deoxyglucarate dehydratase n=1 Tax=Paenibacillus sp. H1-7 TaxID=2282849 RepID=UPI001EF7C5B5|nr:5-dehydro-4-deoxyglucarate dehydratase [Paenibacillus sp. H1-7]ULL13761.1 5-dehydro-4-deoxyglucarate dehydratase [Paenibacillus sp. H1-7]